MPWQITDGVLHEQGGRVIGTLSPDILPQHFAMIKQTPDVIHLALGVRDFCDAGRKFTKKVVNEITLLIETFGDYKVNWTIDNVGDLIDDAGRKVCFFSERDSIDAILILFVPDFINALNQNMSPFTSSDSSQKPLNDRLKMVLHRLDKY